MDNMPMLKRMVCLLSCQPRDMEGQLAGALECLQASINAQAVGICWPTSAGGLLPHAHHPGHFQLDDATRDAITQIADPAHPAWGQSAVAWMTVPMKVGGYVLGRLWLVARPDREFTQDDREFIMMAGNQLALALENSRLNDEMQHLAARRGELLRRVIATQDERCRRISRELHDEISQSLTAMALDIEAVQIADRTSQEAALLRLNDLRPRLLAALEEVNRIILDLRPTLLEDMGLIAALRWFASQRLEPLGIQVHVRSQDMDGRLQPHIETTLYRIAQEAMTNVAKHAHAQHVWLDMTRADNGFTLVIHDDGCGFEVGTVVSHPDDRVGLGLFGMKERATLAGGTFAVESQPEQGTLISVQIPTELEVTHGADSGLAG